MDMQTARTGRPISRPPGAKTSSLDGEFTHRPTNDEGQPWRLIDSWGRVHDYLRISVTDRCNLSCVYCQPPGGIEYLRQDLILSSAEIIRLAQIFAAMGVTKIRLTGGEPLVRKNIDKLIADLTTTRGITTVGLTTNGVLLRARLNDLRSAGLTNLNVSLDTLRADRYAEITLRDEHTRVMRGIDAALAPGFVSLKLNVVVIGGINDDEILDFVETTRTLPITVRFIEYMPFLAGARHRARFVSAKIIRETIEKKYSLVPVSTARSAVAREYYIPGFTGTFGLISPMSDQFCCACNRLRLTAEGSLKSCLFYPAAVNLLERLRAGDSAAALADIIRRAVSEKHRAHPAEESSLDLTRQEMIRIGG